VLEPWGEAGAEPLPVPVEVETAAPEAPTEITPAAQPPVRESGSVEAKPARSDREVPPVETRRSARR
jgi:hypothetical protein